VTADCQYRAILLRGRPDSASKFKISTCDRPRSSAEPGPLNTLYCPTAAERTVLSSPALLRMLFTVAHPDDETFPMGSTISDYAVAGVEVHVDCATQGEVGDIAPESEAIPETLMMQSCRLLRKCSAFLDCLDADWSPDVRCRSDRRGDGGCARRLRVGWNWRGRVKPRTYTRCRLTVITTSPASTAITAAAR